MKTQGIRKARFATGFVLAALGVAMFLAVVQIYFSYAPQSPSEPMFVGLLGSHTYFRWVPAPWWQSAIWAAVLLGGGLYLMLSAKRRHR